MTWNGKGASECGRDREGGRNENYHANSKHHTARVEKSVRIMKLFRELEKCLARMDAWACVYARVCVCALVLSELTSPTLSD